MDSLTCTKEACPIASGGRCLEGFSNPRFECPNVAEGSRGDSQAATADATSAPIASARPDGEFVSIRSAADLSEAEAEALCRQTHCRVITVAGIEESGKSALVTCPFHLLVDEPFAGYAFAGSRTLAGFDERCHRARVESGRDAATIGRTSGDSGRRFLHLRVSPFSVDEGGNSRRFGKPIDLLLTDISGEDFRHARDNADDAKSLTILRRTDRLAIMLDGALVRDSQTRQGAARDSVSLFRSVLDAGMIDSRTAVDFVITKWDLIADAGPRDDVVAFLDEVEARTQRFANRVAQLRWHRVAALPTRQSVQLGFGVDVLLKSWITSTFQILPREVVDPTRAQDPTEYGRLGYRYLANTRGFDDARQT